MKKTWLRVVLLALTAVFLLSSVALAIDPIVLDHDVELTIRYQDGNVPLVGARFDLYRVADTSEFAEFTLSGDFKDYPVKLDGLDNAGWQAAANTLAGYAAADGLTPLDSGVTDRNGLLTFPTGEGTLTPGLYLVVGWRHTAGNYVYTPEPFLISLPNRAADEDQWTYQVEVEPKFDRTQLPPPDETTERRVLKVWKDGDGKNRPQSVTVMLLKDGVVYDTVVLDESNGWRYSWDKLEAGHTWTVVEKPVDGYTVTVTREGVTFVVENTSETPTVPTPSDQPDQPNEPNEPALPQTGLLWWPVPVLLAAGLLLLALGQLKRRGKQNET